MQWRNDLVLVFFTLFILGIVFSGNSQTWSSTDLSLIGEWGTGNYQDVFIEGTYAFCAASEAGLDVITIADTGKPRRVGSCSTPSIAKSVFVSNGIAYVTTEYN